LVIPCKYSDDSTEPASVGDTLAYFNDIVKFWNRMSYGQMNLQVTVTEYVKLTDFPRSSYSRGDSNALASRCRAQAASQVNLGDYRITAILPNAPTDFFGQVGGYAILDIFNFPYPGIKEPSYTYSESKVAHEIGHTLGLQHSSSESRATSGKGWPDGDYGSP